MDYSYEALNNEYRNKNEHRNDGEYKIDNYYDMCSKNKQSNKSNDNHVH